MASDTLYEFMGTQGASPDVNESLGLLRRVLETPVVVPIEVTETADLGITERALGAAARNINLSQGCYRIVLLQRASPNISIIWIGTMRVDLLNGVRISGDLYRYVIDTNGILGPRELPPPIASRMNRTIPVFQREKYSAYFKATSIEQTLNPPRLSIVASHWYYFQPPHGEFDGDFIASGNLVLDLQPNEPGVFAGSWRVGSIGGSAKIAKVSDYFRRATLEIDTLQGAVSPKAVTEAGVTENFKTIFAEAGWDLTVVYDEVNVNVPAGVDPNICWNDPDLHALMSNVRNASQADLDSVWHLHLLVVPANLGCDRGIMYDRIGVPREGVASFSDDGYRARDNPNYGTAADQLQRNVPRAFLRSACHEVGHGFNQIHQNFPSEPGADNSIMTTTPGVANHLAAIGGIFPEDIALRFNTHVRDHLVHFPDIAIRPGGMTFSGRVHSPLIPVGLLNYFSADVLELELQPASRQIALGEPLQLRWTLTNRSHQPVPVPSDISIDALHTLITVTDPGGTPRLMPAFVIKTDSACVSLLQPGQSSEATTRLFWSSQGFAFMIPGKHLVEVRIVWQADGVPVGVRSNLDIWVNYPASAVDNDAAFLLLHPQVGMYVALGGGDHLTEAVSRLQLVASMARDEAGPIALRGYQGILPPKEEAALPSRQQRQRKRE